MTDSLHSNDYGYALVRAEEKAFSKHAVNRLQIQSTLNLFALFKRMGKNSLTSIQ